jgi:RNA polymerase sigma factor (sigma-70 family)
VSPDRSVSLWLEGLKGGDAAAVQPLWERYFQQLVQLARRKLRDASRRVADEEDVALSAFDSFCRGAERGKFPRLEDRNDLWQLLVVITARKASDLQRNQRRQKRGGNRVRGESVFQAAGDDSSAGGLQQVLGAEPTPEFAAQTSEELQRLLDALGDETLRQIALWKLENRTHPEIAGLLGVSEETVRRKLVRIRMTWDAAAGEEA